MQALSTAVPGKWYTIKWMFGVPEVLEKLKEFKIKEGSEIHVIQNDASGMMIIAIAIYFLLFPRGTSKRTPGTTFPSIPSGTE